MVKPAENALAVIIENFCQHFGSIFPKDTAMVQVAKNDYLKTLTSKN